MGAFSLFRRLRASEPAKTTSEPSAVASTGKSTASNSKSSDSVELRKVTTKPKKPASKAAASTSNPAPSASSDATVAIPAVAPRVDLSILRSPSPPLVEVSVDGYRANSPWVDLAAEVEAPRRGSFGFGFIRSPSSSPTTRAVNEKLVEYLDGKLITPEQATVLVQACAKVLQGQALETLGIFRPWRLAESPYIISRTLGLFLRAIYPEDAVPLEDRDLLGYSSTTDDPLDAFKEALADAGTHNAVACLKWGLRHLQYGPHGFAGDTCSTDWRFYTDFLESEAKASYDVRAFKSLVLERLPEEHSALLTACLELFAAVAAHDSQNAMPGLHLCRLTAFWLFGRQHEPWNDWLDLYQDYLMAAACLEHLFLSYLRYQDKIPLRLKGLITPYPPEQERLAAADAPHSMHLVTPLNAIHIMLQAGKNSSAETPGLIKARRLPGAILASAIEASAGQEASHELSVWWRELAASAKAEDGDGVNLQSFVAEETERIFSLVAERAERNKRVRVVGDRRASSYGNRRRSASIDVGMMQSTSSKSSDSTGRNRALSNDARMQSSPSQAGDFSWGDFASKGFSDEFDSDSFSLFSEVGRPSIDEEASLARSPQKLKKPYPYASLASRHMQFERRYYAERDEQANTPVVAAVKEIKIVQIDPIFAEVYLDSLENPAITSKWPVFALAELKGTKLPYKAIVVEVENVRPITQAVLPSCSTVSVPLSPSMGAKTAAKQRRGLFSIGGRKKRMSIHDSGREAQDSSDRAEKARFDEFGKRIAVKSESFNSQQQAQAHGSRSPRPFSLVKGIRESKSASPAADRESKVMPTTEAKTPVRSSPKPDTIAEVNETIEERSTPSPSISKSSSGRKLSRKPVPLVPGDEEAALDEVAEATNALDQASPAKGQAEMVSHAHAETSLDEVQIQHLEDASPQVPLEDSAFLAETADQATTIKTGEKGDDDNLESLKVGCLPIVIIPDAYNDGTELKPQNSKSDLRKEATVHAIPDEVVTQGDARAISTGVPEQPDLDEAPVKCEPSEGDSETLPAVAKGAVTIEEVEEVPGTSLPAQSPDVAEEPPDSDVVSKVDQEESEAKVERATEQLTHFRKADAVVDAEPEEENDAKSSTTEPPESTPKRFGSTLNRVSPSLKERFGSSSKPSSAQGEDKVMPKSSKTHPPPSPSRRAALLSGAKKMLTRRKSTPSDLDSITASKSIEHPSVPPIAMVPVVPKNSSAAEAQRGVEEPVKVSQTSAAEVVETTELPESEAERTILPPENNVSELVEKPLPSSQTAKSEEMSCTRPSAAQADAPRIAIDEHGLSEVTAQAVPQSVGDQECMQPTGIDSQVFREEHENLSTETASVEVEEESLEDGVPTLVHNPAESTKGLEPKHDSEAPSEVSDDRLELFEAGKSKAVQDEAESPVSEANGTVPEEAPSTLLSPMATVLSTAENALAASVSSLGAVALSVLPSSLTGPSEPPTDADKPITGESASPRMDLESMIDHDVPQIASLQESPADEEHQAADPADSSVHDETLDTASLEQEQEASTIDNSQEVKGVDAHIIGDILGPQDHEHSEEISEAVEQYKTGSLRDGASTTVDEVRNEELKQQDIPEQVEQGDLTEDSEGIRHDQAEDEVASDQVANDIASQTDLVESDNAAGEVAPPAEDPLPAHQASPVVDGEEHTVLQRPTELVEHNEGSVLREDDLTSRNQASKSSSEVRSQEASLEELVEESEAMPLAAEEDERAVNPVSEAAQSPTDVDQPNTSATDFRQGQEIKQSPDASIDSLPDVLLQHDVPMGQETSRDRESVDEDDAGPCKDDEEVEHDRMTRHTRPEGDTTAQDMFGHLATAEQAESTASITTSPISGLPIHVSQQIDKPLFGGHDAFHKNEAQEHMHDVQAAASASTVQPEAELDLPINNQEPRDMTIDAQTLAQHESAGTFEQATTFREYNFARAASDQEEAIPPTENADPILAITDPRPPPQDDQHEIDDFAENPERNRSDVAPAVVQRAAGDSDDANAGQMVFNTVQQEDIVEAPTNKASLIPEALLAEVEARKEKLHLEQHAEHPQEGDAISQDDAALDIASKAL